MKKMKTNTYIAILVALIAGLAPAYSQEKLGNGLEIDKTVHNFGDIMLGSGPVSCTFTLTNRGDKPAVIYNVVSTCGCTGVKWTKEPIRPGMSGTVSATYSNDEGPYPFDKNLTVYLSDVKKPLILKLRGVSHQKEKSLEELYPVSYGPLAIRESELKCGNLEQGGMKSEAVIVANLSRKPIDIRFTDITEGLEIKVSPNPIPARGTAEMSFTVKASREKWGKNWYWATPTINGQSCTSSKGDSRIGIWAFTKENFSSFSDARKAAGARPTFKESTWSFGNVRQGETIDAEFTFTNDGKEPFCVYKVDSDACCWSHSTIPVAPPGQRVSFRVHLDTSKMPKGESLTIVTLTTNSPLRPIVNLFIAGFIQ